MFFPLKPDTSCLLLDEEARVPQDVDEYLLDVLIHEELKEELCRNEADLIRSLPF